MAARLLLLSALLLVAFPYRMHAQTSGHWYSADSIREGYGFIAMEVVSNGDIYCVLRHANTDPTTTYVVRKKYDASEFATFWLPDPPTGTIKERIGLASFDSTLYVRGAHGYKRFDANGDIVDILCVDSLLPNWLFPVSHTTLFIGGVWSLHEPVGGNNTLCKVVRNESNASCSDQYVAYPSVGQGAVSCVTVDDKGVPFLCLKSRRPNHADTMIRTAGGNGLFVNGFDLASSYDAVFLSKEHFGWALVLDPIGKVWEPGLLLMLKDDFSLLSSHPLPGRDQTVQSVRSTDGRLIVCQTQIVGVFDLRSEQWQVFDFEDVVGRPPSSSEEPLLYADIQSQDLYVCAQQGIREFQNFVTNVTEQTKLIMRNHVVARSGVAVLQTHLPDGPIILTVWSVLGQRLQYTAEIRNGWITLDDSILWYGLNLVDALGERYTILNSR